MNQPLANAVVQHMLDTSHLYQQSCAMKNGLPQAPPRIVIGESSTATPEAPPVPATLVQPADIPSGLPKWIKAAVLGAAAAFSGAGLIGGAATAIHMAWPSAAATGGNQAAAPAVPVDRDASLLQYLEDQGLHVPPEKRAHP